MTQTDTVSKSVYPKIFLMQMLRKVESCHRMVNALTEVQVLLRFDVSKDFLAIVRDLIGSVSVDAIQETDKRLAERSASLGDVVKPGKEVPRCNMVIKSVLEAGM